MVFAIFPLDLRTDAAFPVGATIRTWYGERPSIDTTVFAVEDFPVPADPKSVKIGFLSGEKYHSIAFRIASFCPIVNLNTGKPPVKSLRCFQRSQYEKRKTTRIFLVVLRRSIHIVCWYRCY